MFWRNRNDSYTRDYDRDRDFESRDWRGNDWRGEDRGPGMMDRMERFGSRMMDRFGGDRYNDRYNDNRYNEGRYNDDRYSNDRSSNDRSFMERPFNQDRYNERGYGSYGYGYGSDFDRGMNRQSYGGDYGQDFSFGGDRDRNRFRDSNWQSRDNSWQSNDSWRMGDTRGRFFGRGPKGYRRSDERIREEICDRLTEHSYLDASGIEIQVKNAEVTLTGQVPERQMKRLAEDLAESINGVSDVHNQLRVASQFGSEMETGSTGATTAATAGATQANRNKATNAA